VHFSLSLCLSISLSLYLSLYLPLIHVSISSFEFLFFIHFYFQLLTFFSVCLSTVFFLPISFSFFLSSFWFFAFLSFFCLRCLHKWTRKRLLLKRWAMGQKLLLHVVRSQMEKKCDLKRVSIQRQRHKYTYFKSKNYWEEFHSYKAVTGGLSEKS